MKSFPIFEVNNNINKLTKMVLGTIAVNAVMFVNVN